MDMLDLNDDILDHSASDDLFPISSSFENDNICQDNLPLTDFDTFTQASELQSVNDSIASIHQLGFDDKHLVGDENLKEHSPEVDLNADQQSVPIHKDQIYFTGIYTDTEINRMKDEVENCESIVSNLSSEVHHHENLVSLAKDTSGYADEVSKLNEFETKLNDAISKLNNAQEKLNNAV
jgi:hypothetical protein